MKIQLEMMQYPLKSDKINFAIAIRGGFAVKSYLLGEQVFRGNYAFFNVLMGLCRASFPQLTCDTLRATTIISGSEEPKRTVLQLNAILRFLLGAKMEAESFETAKSNTKKNFMELYKNGEFRAMYKSVEFSDLNKQFSLKDMIADIDALNFAQFSEIKEKLIVPGNLCVFMCGNIEQVQAEDILVGDVVSNNASYDIRIAGVGYDPVLREDAGIINLAREKVYLVIEAFSFGNSRITNFTKRLFLDLLSATIESANRITHVDSLDASIVFKVDVLQSCRDSLHIDDSESFEKLRTSVMQDYLSLLTNDTAQFVVTGADMMASGIYIDQYLSFLDTFSYGQYVEMLSKVDLMISEGQIALIKGGKSNGRLLSRTK